MWSARVRVTGEADALLSCCSSTAMARRLQPVPQGVGLPADGAGAVPEQKVSGLWWSVGAGSAAAEK